MSATIVVTAGGTDSDEVCLITNFPQSPGYCFSDTIQIKGDTYQVTKVIDDHMCFVKRNKCRQSQLKFKGVIPLVNVIKIK